MSTVSYSSSSFKNRHAQTPKFLNNYFGCELKTSVNQEMEPHSLASSHTFLKKKFIALCQTNKSISASSHCQCVKDTKPNGFYQSNKNR